MDKMLKRMVGSVLSRNISKSMTVDKLDINEIQRQSILI